MILKTQWLGSFTTEVRDETYRNGKDMKIKHSVSSTQKKYRRTVFS